MRAAASTDLGFTRDRNRKCASRPRPTCGSARSRPPQMRRIKIFRLSAFLIMKPIELGASAWRPIEGMLSAEVETEERGDDETHCPDHGRHGRPGETISTKMADAGYRVAVTYSPQQNVEPVARRHEGEGLRFHAYGDVADFDSAKACIAMRRPSRAHRRAGQQCGHHRDTTFKKMDKAAGTR